MINAAIIKAKRLNNLYRTMTLRDQIEASTNAATRLQCGNLKTVRERERDANIISKTSASRVSDEKRKGGCFWLL